ncbi:MAG: P-II family nitrogen regulator [Planctomycetia bacterium]|nr:P-II family nitrogen regulator [Planctomycetia bacterium]
MKLVMAVMRPGRVEAVRQALAAVHVTRLSIADGLGFADSPGAADAPGVAEAGPVGEIVQESILEIAVNDDFLSRTVDTIATAASRAADDRGASIYVLPIEQAVQIYRDVRGPEAI